MPHLRRFYGTLTVLTLLVPLLVLTATPAAAQDDDEEERIPPVTVFVFSNAMTNAERERRPHEDWEVQVSIQPLSGCAPTRGDGARNTAWIDAGGEAGALLSLEECIFSIAAVARDNSRDADCTFAAQLAWGRQPADGDYVDNRLLTLSRPDGESRLSIRRKPGGGCGRPNRTHFVIRADDVVEALPGASADADLLALARRAAALTAFEVTVAPDHSSDAVASPGCNRITTHTVPGDGERVPSVLHDMVGRGTCPLRATISAAPTPFETPEGNAVSFDGSGVNILIELSRLVRLRPARIAIIQDVQGSLNRGAVSYAITRSCGDVSVSSPAPSGAVSPLAEGRYTVHAPYAATFGPTAAYPVGAASSTSSAVVGCSVIVTISGVPAGCTVPRGFTRTLTWSVASPIENFDFEFAILCGAAAADSASDASASPPGTTGDTADTSDDDSAAVPTTADVRIVARELSNGKIEFGLQQRDEQHTWGHRRLPRARLFPADGEVGRWLVSTPLTVSASGAADAFVEEIDVRIVARRLSTGRVEFGLQERRDGGPWGDRQLPTRRFFPAESSGGRWLGSSDIVLNG